MSDEFLLKWNNYYTTLSQIFTKWWKDGSFVDCTLVVEGKQIPCHRVVLSACSSFFENLLLEHSHPHPIVILHAVPYEAVNYLIEFMYNGQVHISRDMMSDVIKVAKSLQIKGISDSPEISDFTNNLYIQGQKQASTSQSNHTHSSLVIPNNLPYSTALAVARNFGMAFNAAKNIPEKILRYPLKKKRRIGEPFPLSPPTSVGESQTPTSVRESQIVNQNGILQNTLHYQTIKEEFDDEKSDNELHIDESASPNSPHSRSSNTPPGVEVDNQDLVARLESAQSLASLATHGATLRLMHQGFSPISNNNSLMLNGNTLTKKVKAEPKNNARRYTTEQLQQAVEAVIGNRMQPAKAISVYGIPRRTFFRKLSNERKARGISSTRENTSDAYLASSRSASPMTDNSLANVNPTDIGILKSWQDNTNKFVHESFLNINKTQNFELAQHYFKSLTEQHQKENEGRLNDSVSSSNSLEKPLGVKNTIDT